MTSVQERQAQRRAFLLALYELTNADTMAIVKEADVAKHLGLDPEAADRIARSVVDQGYAAWRTMGGNMGITPYGIEVAEAELGPASAPPAPEIELTVTEKMITRLQEFLDMIDASYIEDVSGILHGEDPELADKLRARLPLIQRILNEIEPGLGDGLYPSGSEWPWSGVRNVVINGIGQLQTRREAEELLGPQGPKLVAMNLHPWVWNAAAKLWENGHRREALQKAATQIESSLKTKLGRHNLSGTKLFEQAFTPNPPTAGEPRLRIPGFPPGSESFKNLHLGAKDFGSGCMLAIRNIVTHEPTEPEEQMALEQLAALSVLARWIDAAVVETVNPSG